MADLYCGSSSNTARSNTLPPQQQKIWHPSNGIVFRPSNAPATHRPMSTTAAAELEQDLMLQSNAEDNYVLAEPLRVAESKQSLLKYNASVTQDTPEGTIPKPKEIPQPETKTEPQAEFKPEDPARNELPQSTLPYKMTEDLFRKAREADSGSPESYWSYTLYRNDEGKKVTVHYCKSKHTTERVIKNYFLSKKVIGFDIEWKAEATKKQGAKQNVSLIQIASEERIALFHIAQYASDKISDLVSDSLKKLMEDPDITKVGVSIRADCTRLRNFLNIDSKGILELSHLYKLVKYSSSRDFKSINKRLVSLATQVDEHLHLPLFKGEVRSSDWSKALKLDQILYSASDSYAGVVLYDILEIKRNALDPTPPRPFHAELNQPIRLAEGEEIPVDEAAEELEPVDTTPSKPIRKRKSKPYPVSSSTPDSGVEINLEDSDADFQLSQEVTSTSSPSTARSKSTPKTAKSQQPKSPLLIEAEEKTTSHRAKTSTSTRAHRATFANLRTYFLWSFNPELSLGEIAALLRDPPLQTRTVASYILEAIKLEELPYEHDRLRHVLRLWQGAGGAKGVMEFRYRGLEKDVGLE